MDEAEMHQTNLLKNWNEFSEKSKPRTKKGRYKKSFFEIANALYECRELVLNAFSDIFPIKKLRRTIKNINFKDYQ